MDPNALVSSLAVLAMIPAYGLGLSLARRERAQMMEDLAGETYYGNLSIGFGLTLLVVLSFAVLLATA